MEKDILDELSAGQAEEVAARSLIEEERTNFEKQRQSLSRERDLLQQVSGTLKAKEELLKAELDRASALQKGGYFTLAVVDTKRADLIAAQQAIIQNEAALQSTQRQIEELAARIRVVPVKIAELHSQRYGREALLRQKLTQVTSQANEVLVAPISGTVLALQAKLGQNLSAGATVAVLMPDGDRLEAELFVPSRAIGFIRIGQAVALHYQAFPYQRYGAGRGKISAISKIVLAPVDTPSIGVEMKEPVFRVRVELDQSHIVAYGNIIPLQSGMLSNASVVLERRSLFEVLFDRSWPLVNEYDIPQLSTFFQSLLGKIYYPG